MPRPRSSDPRTTQLNVRLTDAQADGLAAIEYTDEVSGPEFLRELLDVELSRRQRDQIHVQALRVRAEARLRRQGGLLKLPAVNDAS